MDPELLYTPFYREITEYFLAYNNKDIEKVFEILKEDYFISDAHKVLWVEIRKLFNKYDSPPTYDMLRMEISHYPESDQKDSTLEILKDIEKKVNRQEIELRRLTLPLFP